MSEPWTVETVRGVLAKHVPAPVLVKADELGLKLAVVKDMGLEEMLRVSERTRRFVRENFRDNLAEAIESYNELEGDFSTCTGRYVHEERLLCIRADADEWTIVHEFGHFVDQNLMPEPPSFAGGLWALLMPEEPAPWWSDTHLPSMAADEHPEEWARYRDFALGEGDVSDEELEGMLKPLFVTDYAVTSPSEGFAEAYALYYGCWPTVVKRRWVNPDAIPVELRKLFDQLAKDGTLR